MNFIDSLSQERNSFFDELIEKQRMISPGIPADLKDLGEINAQVRSLMAKYTDILADKIIRSMSTDFPPPPGPLHRAAYMFRGRIDVDLMASELAVNRNLPFPVLYIASNSKRSNYGTEIELLIY